MKINTKWLIVASILFFIIFSITIGCSSNQMVAEKTGAQLWGENCVRCHNAPSPTAFSDVQWETIAMHMRVRANLQEDDVKKVVEFLKMAN